MSADGRLEVPYDFLRFGRPQVTSHHVEATGCVSGDERDPPGSPAGVGALRREALRTAGRPIHRAGDRQTHAGARVMLAHDRDQSRRSARTSSLAQSTSSLKVSIVFSGAIRVDRTRSSPITSARPPTTLRSTPTPSALAQ